MRKIPQSPGNSGTEVVTPFLSLTESRQRLGVRRDDAGETVLHERGVAAEESPPVELSVESGDSNVKRIRTWLAGLLRRRRLPAIEPPQPRAALPSAERVPVATSADAHTVSSVSPLPLRATSDEGESFRSSRTSTDVPSTRTSVHTGMGDERYATREGAHSHGGSPVMSRVVSGIETAAPASPEPADVTGLRETGAAATAPAASVVIGRSRGVQPRRVFRGPSATRKVRVDRVGG